MSLARLGAQWTHQFVLAPKLKAVRGPAAAPTDERFEALTKYIPTETVTLFVAAMSAIEAAVKLHAAVPAYLPWLAYLVFAVLSPVFVYGSAVLVYKDARKKAEEAGSPIPEFKPPGFRMTASLLAFCIWALAVPGLLDSAIWQIAAGFGAVFISTILSFAGRFFE